ncbi:hypothetical protein SPHINGO8BC_60660 [Sphingobacterium multivorum]|uniref:Uncharacterized protein n=1 Tax=Sphingobacterium multivorum TaxID=28454 RepID=A0A654DKK9_SPHMU|nr:hypothetical protein SPHINGO8BC_60660 [Sphingobacterium multivorum]
MQDVPLQCFYGFSLDLYSSLACKTAVLLHTNFSSFDIVFYLGVKLGYKSHNTITDYRYISTAYLPKNPISHSC